MRAKDPTAARARGEGWLHFRKWLRHGRSVAALTPSGRALAVASCGRIDRERPQVIVELGAGTGAVTRAAATRMHPDSRLIAIEQDPDFARMLDASVPAAEVVCGAAEDFAAILDARGVTAVDVVLNGLPTPSLPAAVRDRIYRDLSSMPGRPWVSQITVMPWVFQRFYRGFFEEVSFEPAWANLPPGGVYHCRGLRLGAA